jgi:1,4-dihydroxy-2-naphthoyl-CoA hydrolase
MSFRYDYTIQFRDTDAAGVVYFASILSICHIAYEASLIESGINLKSFVNNPEFAVPIIHASADFYKPLYCGDLITIELTPRSIDNYRFEVNYQLGAATAITRHVVIDPSTRQRKELPPILTEWLAKI